MKAALAGLLGAVAGAAIVAAWHAAHDADFMARLVRATEACDQVGMVLEIKAGAEPECVRRR